MASVKKKELMPIGGVIAHDEYKLKIEKRLSAGLTGEVYEGWLTKEGGGKIHVAVKAMKTLEFPAARQLFLQESETLAFLMHLEEQENREQGTALKIAPVYYGRGEYQDNPYLVMEFINGKQILTDLLPNRYSGKFPEERQALTAAWHLFRMLDVLHRLLKKTYIDLKSENLWWVEDGENAGALKMTDFGTMEEIKPDDAKRRGVARDLLRAASYFCKMTTGYMPDFLLDELRQFDELKKQLNDADISWGVKRELKRLLHRDSSKRPTDAASTAAALRTLVDFWTLDVQKVLDVARKTLERAQSAHEEAEEKQATLSQKGLDAALRAKSAFEILSKRAPDLDLSREKEQLEQILKSFDHLERGKNLLRGRSYLLAKNVFREGMTWEDEAAALRRWAYLAELGEEISPADFEAIQPRAFAALETLTPRGFWEKAAEEFNAIHKELAPRFSKGETPKGLEYLLAEIETFRLAGDADAALAREDFSAAEEWYDQAQKKFEILSAEYQQNILENDLPNLKESALAAHEKTQEHERRKAIDAAFDKAIAFFRQYGFEENGATLQARRQAEAAAREAIAARYHTERLREVVYSALQNKNYKESFILAQIALLDNEIPKTLQDDLTTTAALYHAWQGLRIPDGAQFAEELRAALPYAQTNEIVKACVDELLAQSVSAAKRLQDAEMYAALAALHKEVGSGYADALFTESESVQKKKTNERHARIDALVAEAKSLGALNLEEFSAAAYNHTLPYALADILRIAYSKKERYEYILQTLSAAETLARADGYRHDEIKQAAGQLQAEIEKLTRSASEMEKERAAAYERSLDALNRWWFKIEPLFQWRTRSVELFQDSLASRAVHQQLYGEALDFLAACYSLLQGETPTARLEEKLQEGESLRPEESRAAIHVLIENAHRVLNSLGPDAWSAIQKESAQALQKSQAFLLNAKDAFEQGKLAEAQALLEQSKPFAAESQEWKALRAQTLRVALWNQWQREHAAALADARYDAKLLESIRAYKAQKLPAVYWAASSAEGYLNRLEKKLHEQALPLLGDFNNPNGALIQTLREWLDASWTSRYPAAADSNWRGRAWLSGIFPLVVAKDSEAIAKLASAAAIPNAEALSDVNVNVWRAVVQQKEQERREAENRKQAARTRWMIGAGLAAMLCIGMVILGLIFQQPISQMVNGTYTPTPTMTFTVTPSFTPLPTDTPTETPTPTLIPTSTFIAPDASAIRPALPVAAEQAWLLMPDNAAAKPPVTDAKTWTKETSVDANTKGETYYSTQKQARVFWETDQPLNGGFYAIFILDTKSKSGGMPPLQFQVLADRQPLSPFRGQPVAAFKSSAQKQAADEWISLGVYELPAGKKLGLLTNVPALQGDAFFALSKVAIVKISDPQKAMYDALPQARVLFALGDDSSAVVLDAASKSPLPNHQGDIVTDPNAWGGSFRSLQLDSLKGVSNKVVVQWTLPGLIQPGKYQILAWIPAQGATAQGEVALLLNGKALEKQMPPPLNQKDISGKWWQGDLWTISEAGAVIVQFTVDPAANLGGALGIDAIALIRA